MILRWPLVCMLMIPLSGQTLAEESAALEEVQNYLEFATYSDGTITLDQLSDVGTQTVLFIDTRDSGQFSEKHIPDAINIEWREILTRQEEVPKDRTVVFYCNTGTLSAKAQFILRLAGYDNVKVLHGGIEAWDRQQASASN